MARAASSAVIFALVLIAAATSPSEPIRQLLASKMMAGAILDLSKVKVDAAQPSLFCGVVQVNRFADGVEFLADITSDFVWLQQAPMTPGAGGPFRVDASKVYIGHIPPAERAWRACETKGVALKAD